MDADVEPTDMERANRSQEDLRLWDVLQELVEDRGPVRAATALVVNYRTVVGNLEAGSLSRRMRRALQEFEAGLAPAESPDLDGTQMGTLRPLSAEGRFPRVSLLSLHHSLGILQPD